MGNFKIDIETVGLDSKNGVINTKRNELNEFLERQKANAEKLHEAWKGTTGEEVYEKLTNHSKTKYGNYLSQFDRRTKFISNVIEKYTEFDDETKRKIDAMFENKA